MKYMQGDPPRHYSVALVAAVLCVKDLIFPRELKDCDIEDIIEIMREKNSEGNFSRENIAVDVRGLCCLLLSRGRPSPYDIGGNQKFPHAEISEIVGYGSHASVILAIQRYESVLMDNGKRFSQGQFLGARQPPMTSEQKRRYSRS